MFRIAIISLFFIGCSSTSQGIFSKPKIHATQPEITVEDFKGHIEYLASDALGGRSAGSEGDKMAVEYMVDFFKKAPQAEVTLQPFEAKSRRMKATPQTFNVIATLPGNDPKLKEEYVVIGGHYDTTANPKMKFLSFKDGINNGADDNASGTAMVLELFEKYASTKNHKRTLVFVLFGAEELGLIGSKYFVENSTIDLAKVQLMLNLDMVGRLDEEKNVYLGGVPTADNLDVLVDSFIENSNLNVTVYEHTATGVRSLFSRSDHYNFYKKDIPSLFFFTGIHKDYHSPRDEANLVNYEGLKLISDLADKVVLEAANQSDRLQFKSLPKQEESEQSPMRLKVSLGIMPDYSHSGSGMKIESVIDKRPAKQSGMKDGDVILKIHDTVIEDIYKYMEILSKLEPGSKVKAVVLRDNEELTLDVQF
jgi:hypothetical protein